MITRTTLKNKIEIFHFQTGTVAVRPPHKEFSGLPFMRLPRIMASGRWTEPMPITVWLIKSDQGNFLVDTGENVSVFEPDYFGDDKPSAFINRRILKLEIEEVLQIDNQLAEVGMGPADIDGVILTHLHLDHTDGLKFFPNSEVIASRTEWERPFGAASSTFPKWLSPKKIDFKKDDSPFGGRFELTPQISIVPTPGHTHGHQSVIVHDEAVDFMLAGDVSFTDKQLITGGRPGIIIDWAEALVTYDKVKRYAAERPLVYLPSHDHHSPKRLVEKTSLIP